MIAATIPNCRAYDPAFAYEVAVIFDHGARAMMEEGKDEFYYVTAMNENYAQPSMPEGVEGDIIKGLYRVEARAPEGSSARVRLLGSGAILPQVLEAARRLEADWGVASEVWSATSFSELARDAREVERRNRLNPLSRRETSHVARCLRGAKSHHRRNGLCARLSAIDRSLCRGAIHRARHRRVWPQRHACGASQLF